MFRKSARSAPAGYFRWEAAGLRWLAAANAAPVVTVLDVGDDHLDLAELSSSPPSATAAQEFGAALARTHDAGAPAYGSPPANWDGDGFFGPASMPVPLQLTPAASWGSFWAEQRLRPIARLCRDSGALSPDQARLLDTVADRVAAGDFDTGDSPARVHGDLWSGNVMWTPEGTVLIDPAAHGGHREADLAMLELFGAPHLDRILAAYQEIHPLADGWQDRIGLHQLYPVAFHAYAFGGGYAASTASLARRYR